MAYYGFLITVIVNSIIWVVISTLVNQYYWKYIEMKKEFHLISKYNDHKRKRKFRNNFAIKLNGYKKEEEEEVNNHSISSLNSKCKGNNKISNLASPLKILKYRLVKSCQT